MILKETNKHIYTSSLKGIVTQGEDLADKPIISLNRYYQDLDLSEFNFVMTGITNKVNIKQNLLKVFDDKFVNLTWKVDTDFTSAPGEVALSLEGYNEDMTVLIKYTVDSVVVIKSISGEYLPPLDSIEKALLEVQEGVRVTNANVVKTNADVVITNSNANKTAADVKAVSVIKEDIVKLSSDFDSNVIVANNQIDAKVKEATAQAADALKSANNAKDSEAIVKLNAQNAKVSEDNAKTSETNASNSEVNAKASENVASTQAQNSLDSATSAKASEDNSLASANKAKTSEANANTYETNAKASADNAKTSEYNANTSMEATKADAIKTDADVITTNENVIATNADAKTTNENASKTSADVITTNENVIKTVNALADVNKELLDHEERIDNLESTVDFKYSPFGGENVHITNSLSRLTQGIAINGNIFHNLMPLAFPTTWAQYDAHFINKSTPYLLLFKPNTKYTICVRGRSSNLNNTFNISGNGSTIVHGTLVDDILVFTTPAEIDHTKFYATHLYSDGIATSDDGKYVTILALEGDLTNNYIPQYIDGVDSTASDGTLTLKSTGINIFDEETILPTLGFIKQSDGSFTTTSIYNLKEIIWENKINYKGKINLSFDRLQEGAENNGLHFIIYYSDGSQYSTVGFATPPIIINQYVRYSGTSKNTIAQVSHIVLIQYSSVNIKSSIKNISIAYSDVNIPYEQYVEDTKVITLPSGMDGLNSLPNGVSDVVNQDGSIKQLINLGVFDGNDEHYNPYSSQPSQPTTIAFVIVAKDLKGNWTGIGDLRSNNFNAISDSDMYSADIEGIRTDVHSTGDRIIFRIFRSKLATQDVAGFKLWLSQNITKVWYQLETPILHPKTEDINLKTYLDITNIFTDGPVQGYISGKSYVNTTARLADTSQATQRALSDVQATNAKVDMNTLKIVKNNLYTTYRVDMMESMQPQAHTLSTPMKFKGDTPYDMMKTLIANDYYDKDDFVQMCEDNLLINKMIQSEVDNILKLMTGVTYD